MECPLCELKISARTERQEILSTQQHIQREHKESYTLAELNKIKEDE